MVMKTKMIALCVVFLCLISFIAYKLYTQKTFVDFELAYTLNERSDFYPGAYMFFHDFEGFSSHFKMIKKASLIKGLSFDFDKYSYVLTRGRKIKSMYYGWQTSRRYDESPSYGKTKGTIFVHIEYEEEPGGMIYLYKVPHDERLRGLNGL